MRTDNRNYDVAIIGGGPVGCATALAYAREGAEVLLLEANPQAATKRLAGEWLHPPAVKILQDLGVQLTPEQGYTSGRGFVVFPDDGSRAIVLPYQPNVFGLSLHHEELVHALRAAVRSRANIEFKESAKATRIVGQNLSFQHKGAAMQTVYAHQIVGAAGRSSVAHQALGVAGNAGTYSRMAGLLLEDCELPFEGFGHVVLGGLGPLLAYRLSPTHVRFCLDVPLSLRTTRDKEAVLYESYAPAMPAQLREPFRKALIRGNLTWATNQTRSRVMFGRPGLALVGDAVGHHHPLTALGMTLGFQDAIAVARAKSFSAYRRERGFDSRVPEMLAIALYEVFADTHDEVVDIRRAIYDLWRKSPGERMRTMSFLSCEERNPAVFGASFLKAMGLAGHRLALRGVTTSQWGHVRSITRDLGSRIRWLVTGALHLTEARPSKELPRGEDRYAGALRAGAAKADVVELPSVAGHAARTGQDKFDPTQALERGTRALLALQDSDGSWEGECIWCAMLAAQYVIASHIMGLPIDETRRKRLLLHFERTRLPEGLWGLSEVTEPSLFVTTLVYVAARMLGEPKDSSLLAPAADFLVREGGVAAIPSWGKFWLALTGLYEWEGVNPVVPELWEMPRALFVHPSRYYCHTRLIYLSMATLYGMRLTGPTGALTSELRRELYPQGYANIDFKKARKELREGDLYEPPSKVLSLSYDALKLFEKVRGKSGRAETLSRMREHIRWELQTSSHTSISPVSGLLNIMALWGANPNDPDAQQAIGRFDGWLWEDDKDGTRVTGARSAIWDTGFALQALAAVRAHVDVESALAEGDGFLFNQQIRETFPGYGDHFRIDSKGGYPFSWGWHGWPVSDCTAEAILGRLAANVDGGPSDEDVLMAGAFVLRCQGPDGGFGSYEPKRLRMSLEWLNPAEMFGDSMTEMGYTECTASCVVALREIAERRPHLLKRVELSGLEGAITKAKRHIQNRQLPEGPWSGSWGVHYVYGTMFGIRGLLAAKTSPTDPAVRKACTWLKLHQRPDGSWAERRALHTDNYVEHEEGQVIQTAWALTALLEAQDPEWDAIERAARFLARAQLGSGEWPRQMPAGIFFHTALLEYAHYRAYFPVWALGMFETRRKHRAKLLSQLRGEVAAE